MQSNNRSVIVLDVDKIVLTEVIEEGDAVPVRIKVKGNNKYLLSVGADGLAPELIIVKRVGNDLHVSFEQDVDNPDLVLEDFYEFKGQLIGMSEDSTYHEYVSTDDEWGYEVPFLMDGSSSVQALAVAEATGLGDALAMFSGSVIPTSVLGLGALGLLGGAVAVDRSNNGGSSNKAPDKEPGLPEVQAVYDDFGIHQGDLHKGWHTDDVYPLISGKADSAVKVYIYDNDELLGSAEVDVDGFWSYTHSSPLKDGVHKIVVVSEGENGVLSARSEEFDFIVDTLAPANAAVDSVTAGADVVENNGFTSFSRPSFSGTAESGAKVLIFDGDKFIGEAISDNNGSWLFTPQQDFLDGKHSITVVYVDKAGNSSEPSPDYIFTVDTISPEIPVILIILGKDESIIEGGTTADLTPTVAGTAEPGAWVVVYDNDSVLGRVQTDTYGNWSFTPLQSLQQGQHDFSVKAIDSAGNESEASSSFSIYIEVGDLPAAPVIEVVYSDVGVSEEIVSIGGLTSDSKPTLVGMASAGVEVVIYDRGRLLGKTFADESGSWTFEPALPLLNGPHSFIAIAVNSSGNQSSPSESYDFTILVGGIPAAPSILWIYDNVGIYQDYLNKNELTDDAQPILAGTALPGHTVTIYDNGIEIGTTVSDEYGQWIFDMSTPLHDGGHGFTVKSTDLNGKDSVISGVFNIEVDTQEPETPKIEKVYSDLDQQNEILEGATTASNKFILSGKGEEGAWLEIKDNGQVIGGVLIGESGVWEYSLTKPLENGRHSITVNAIDEAGNISPTSSEYSFFVEYSTFYFGDVSNYLIGNDLFNSYVETSSLGLDDSVLSASNEILLDLEELEDISFTDSVPVLFDAGESFATSSELVQLEDLMVSGEF